MMAYKTSESRLFELRRSDWTVLFVGVALCAFTTLLFL